MIIIINVYIYIYIERERGGEREYVRRECKETYG